MLRRLILLLVAIIFLFPNKVYSQERAGIIVLPFKVYALEDLSYMEAEIPGLIKEHLKEEGITIIEPEIAEDVSVREMTESIKDVRNLGADNGADYVVWGSLTWIGQKYSLDAKMIESFGDGSPQVFFVEGESVENLLVTVKELAGNLGMKLFKREKVAKVLVTGNKRIEADAIKRIIKTKPGDVYIAKALSRDLKAVYAMGYFDDIRIESESGPEGKTVIFTVKEKPTIRVIRLKGNQVYKDEEIKKSLDISTGSILNVFRINSNMKRIEELYKDKNYHNVNVTYNLHELDQNQADLEFVIEEGGKLQIEKIFFQGNSTYTGKELKKIIKTSEKGFLSWFTSSGDLDKDDLNQDVAKLTAFYQNNGFIQARVGDPLVDYKDTGIHITIKIDEGPQFKVGNVDITGDLVLPKEELLDRVKIVKETFYNREILRNDVLLLTDLYSDEGYAYADISPRIDRDIDNLVVNITYVARKGSLVYFEKIIIGGNAKTRDKVIRRELKVYEQELYSGRRLKRGMANLYRLDFFEDVKVDTVKGSADDKMILKIDVKEKPTGAFSFGGGYSTVEEAFAMATISQRNLFGRAQILSLKAQLGGRTNRYTLSFDEPWLFDIPLSFGFDIWDWDLEYDEYDKDSLGGGLRFSYPVYDYTRAYLSYKYEDASIENIDQNASRTIKELAGTNVTNSITTALRYDSRDRFFNPTKGKQLGGSIEYAGLGGDIAFTKFEAKAGWFIPLFWRTTGFLHSETGFVSKNSGGKLPDYEKFYLGGMNSLRGFDWRDVSPKDDDGLRIGGNKKMQFNVEYLIPLFKDVGLVGVIFFDTGDVYKSGENIDLGNMRESAGFGFRWYSPMGPIRLENGYILDPKEGEGTGGRWEFSMGQAF